MKTDSTPFVYSLSFIDPKTNLKRWYIGVKCGRGSSPADLWTSYFTSSVVIKKLLIEFGPQSFKTKHKNIKRLTNRFWNSLGWEIKSI